MKKIALIPARSGSKRIPHKNIKDFFGHPLMAYAIRTAINSELFLNEHTSLQLLLTTIEHDVYVSSDSEEYLEIAEKYGAKGILRPEGFAGEKSPDSEWLNHALKHIKSKFDSYAILRPTNPFRTEATLQRAFDLLEVTKAQQIRAVQKVKEHPYKMWSIKLNDWCRTMKTPFHESNYHDLQSKSLPEFCVQNGCLQIYYTHGFYENGPSIVPFFTQGYEGYDINTPEDWILAEELVNRKLVELPKI
ncbi:MAG: acylneuraminate cytidylyltransferase family protein [Gammaproteobacteria bacterium]|nr:acylneuraminate cytidylyltransferase family protein [Gammaproteobacteria bacterium]